MNSVCFHFLRVSTLHNEETKEVLLFEWFSNWNLFGNVKEITIHSASFMCSAMKNLMSMLYVCNNTSRTVTDLHE